MNECFQNTDREIWRETPGDYYSDSIHVTEHGAIGIDCGGKVVVKTVREWHKLAIYGGDMPGEELAKSEIKLRTKAQLQKIEESLDRYDQADEEEVDPEEYQNLLGESVKLKKKGSK